MAKLTDVPQELLVRIFAQIPFEDRVAAVGACRATARLLQEPSLWQAAVFGRCPDGRTYQGASALERRRANSGDAWASALSLQRWVWRHGRNLQQLQFGRLPLFVEGKVSRNAYCEYTSAPEMAAAGVLLGNIVAAARLTALRLDEAASEHLSRPALNCIALLGPSLRHLVLLDVRLTCCVAVAQAVRSLLHLQTLAVRFAMGLSAPPDYNGQEYDAGDSAPDVLDVASAAGVGCQSLRVLCLSADMGCVQERIREDRGHSSLVALSRLTRLSCLQLAELYLMHWPAQLSCLTGLQQLVVADVADYILGESGRDAGRQPAWPIPHALQAMEPHLQGLHSSVLSWRQPLPGSLTRLVLTCHSDPAWEDEAQWRPLLQQLPGLPHLATLAFDRASWVPPHMRHLTDALQRCPQLRELQLLKIYGCIAALLPYLGRLSHLHALAVADPTSEEYQKSICYDSFRQHLSQLAACRRLHWQYGRDITSCASLFDSMPALEQLTVGFATHGQYEDMSRGLKELRGRRSLPAVQMVYDAVPLLSKPSVEVPFEECNGVVGQQLDKLVNCSLY